MGGSIGLGMPLATGAAVACPDRKVVSLQADGSAMYTVQALWTAARYRLPIVWVIFNNTSYRILKQRLVAMRGLAEQADTFVGLDHATKVLILAHQNLFGHRYTEWVTERCPPRRGV